VRPALRLAIAVALYAAAAAGCGVGSGDEAGEAGLTVSRDFGAEVLLDESEEISESDSVLRLLDRSAEIETRYGGGFVQSIDGLSGGRSEGRASDWFFYVNGIESPVGAAEYEPGDGDRVWWDHHDWSSAMRVPAVVGSWPEPFLHGFDGERWSAEVECVAMKETCRTVTDAITAANVTTAVGDRIIPRAAAGAAGPSGEEGIRVLVGTWAQVRIDPTAGQLAGAPDQSGVFARFSGGRRALLTLLNERGEPAGTLGRSAGLVAALRPDQRAPTWVVTGTDPAGVEAAAGLLGEPLEDRFAVATDGAGEPIGVPVP
jgi:Domain of unknown function (DUF4430)